MVFRTHSTRINIPVGRVPYKLWEPPSILQYSPGQVSSLRTILCSVRRSRFYLRGNVYGNKRRRVVGEENSPGHISHKAASHNLEICNSLSILYSQTVPRPCARRRGSLWDTYLTKQLYTT
ncbi:hypothetical protein J6590_059913 [Homalodisca vitripennis]|nr:hypothetical protein J6590_059913 [Homalodisca vitripennis]